MSSDVLNIFGGGLEASVEKIYGTSNRRRRRALAK